jgi:hypothetical protein
MPESREPQGLRLTNDDSFHKKRTGFGSHHVLKWFEFPNDSRGMSGGLNLGGDFVPHITKHLSEDARRPLFGLVPL